MRYTTRLFSVLIVAFAIHVPVMGQWAAVPVPVLEDDALLYGVHVVAADDVWAVGRLDRAYAPFQADWLSLTLHWDGSSWSRIPSPSPGLFPNGGITVELSDVDGVAGDDLWAAGSFRTQHVDGFVGSQALMLHWDGASWEQVEAPFTPVGTTGGFVNDLLALASDDVFAFGQRAQGAPGPRTVGFALHWDGSDWRELPPPPTTTIGSYELREATRLTDGRVLVIGGQSGPTGLENTDHSYAVIWDGDSWAEVSPPDFALQTYLRGVARTPDGTVWVVGHLNDGIQPEPLLLRWEGGSDWTRFLVPGFDPPAVRLEDVAALNDGSVVAVGLVTDSPTPATPLPLYLHWDGETWRQRSADPAGASNGWLRGVAAVGACGAIAVGQQGGLEPRIDQYGCSNAIFRDDFESGDLSVWGP